MTDRQRVTNILKFWRAVEIFDIPSLQKNDDEKTFAYSSYNKNLGKPFPWQKSISEKVYFQVYLGFTSKQHIIRHILSLIPDSPEMSIDEKERIDESGGCFAVFCVDGKGKPVEKSYTLASFIIGIEKLSIPESLESINDELQNYSLAFDGRISSKFSVNDDKKQVDWDFINDEIDLITKIIRYPLEEENIEVFVRCFGLRNNSEISTDSDLINSFFLSDLDTLVNNSGEIFGQALEAYLSTTNSEERRDILVNETYLKQCLRPELLPMGRWATNPEHFLMLAQQAAVFKILDSSEPHSKLISVNGPPGTGKTTLLQDVVADVIIKRAEKISVLRYPKDLFKGEFSSENIKVYSLDCNIMQNTQIVVASSNNNAVKNISAEIPTKIDSKAFPDTSYIKEVALNKFGESAWGLVAAPLGNAVNKHEFISKVYDPFEGRDTELLKNIVIKNETKQSDIENLFGEPESKANDIWIFKKVKKSPESAEYISVSDYFLNPSISEIEIKFSSGIVQSQHVNKVFVPDMPCTLKLYLEHWKSNYKEASKNWKVAKDNFNKKLKIFNAYKEHIISLQPFIEEIYELEEALTDVESKLAEENDKSEQLRLQISELVSQKEALGSEKKSLERQQENEKIRLGQHERRKPWILAVWFKFLSYKLWLERYEKLEQGYITVNDKIILIDKEFKCIDDKIDSLSKLNKSVIDELHEQKKAILLELEKLQSLFNPLQTKDINFPDKKFFAQEKQEIHLKSLWTTKEVEVLRAELFLAALKLHEWTMCATAGKWDANMKAVKGLLNSKGGVIPADELLSIWNMLFFITPVVSTTFASFSRLFKGLGKETLGWLLVDEAGQSTPQMAAGAIWRSKRAVIIGDPMQIEPVMTVPNIIVEKMKRHYKVDECLCPLTASVQTVADRTMEYGSYVGDTWVGLPLRGHRRCIEPMFSVSNEIAYGNQMVQANKKPEQISCVLGNSCWLDVQGFSQGQVVREEIEFLSETLQRLKEDYPIVGNGKEAVIYVIAPFRKVAYAAQKAVRKLGLSGKVQCGTVHTFQGKEADIVFIVLGSATGKVGAGSRNWVCSKPNLLNVALTRAKLRVYIIGHYADWSELSYFNVLCRSLKVQKI